MAATWRTLATRSIKGGSRLRAALRGLSRDPADWACAGQPCEPLTDRPPTAPTGDGPGDGGPGLDGVGLLAPRLARPQACRQVRGAGPRCEQVAPGWGPLLRRPPGWAAGQAGMAPDGPVSHSQPPDGASPSLWYIDPQSLSQRPPRRPPARGAADGAIPHSGTASKLSWEPESPLFTRVSGLSHRESDTPCNRNHPGI